MARKTAPTLKEQTKALIGELNWLGLTRDETAERVGIDVASLNSMLSRGTSKGLYTKLKMLRDDTVVSQKSLPSVKDQLDRVEAVQKEILLKLETLLKQGM
ncbi:MAG: hypothetical protein QM610_15955 [Chitinophagaceae bacterium]